MGFIIGILVGAVAALLYAPKAGDELREELRLRSDDLRRRTDDLQRIAQKLAGEAQAKGKELVDEAKTEWNAAGTGGVTGTTGSVGPTGTSGTAGQAGATTRRGTGSV
ncbi:MAG TPA: YtxH domain-containing protein [Candidatus Limnocylindria bacterium]|nr:YtxH domain-containing protein [Candidatus Limnocylindria bacterium]